MKVKAWEEVVTIPTYEVGKPEKNPMFLKKSLSGKQWSGVSLSGNRNDFGREDRQGLQGCLS